MRITKVHNSQYTWRAFEKLLLFSHVQLFASSWTATLQASLSSTMCWSLLKLMSTESVMPSNRLVLCHPFSSCLQSFPASRSFLMSWLFASGGQSIEASASVLLINIQGWFPLELTGWISLQSKGLSKVFCNTTGQNHQFFIENSSLEWELIRKGRILDPASDLLSQNF